MVDEQNLFDQPVKHNMRAYDNIWKIPTGQGDEGDAYTTGCLLGYLYFNKHYKLLAIDLSKKKVLDTDLKAMQQISFTENLFWERNAKATMLFIIEEAKKHFRFFTRNYESIVNIFAQLSEGLWPCSVSHNLFWFNIKSI